MAEQNSAIAPSASRSPWAKTAVNLRPVCRSCQPPVLMVTENGAAFDDVVTPAGEIADEPRRAYLEGHLAAAGDAIADGVPLGGYFAWSVMDNFEWAHGYSKRFGLYRVDSDAQRRTLKRSGRW